MKFNVLSLLVGLSVLNTLPISASALILNGFVEISQTSDTAAKAKTEATNLARRQILSDVLSKYSNSEDLFNLLSDTPDEDLVNLISSSSVSNEQISTTVYSAKISMDIDNIVAKNWLDEHNVQNWIPISENSEKFSLLIVVPNGISDWAELKRIARENNTEIETYMMSGYQIIAKMPLNARNRFTVAVREAGWHYADNSGVLQIWK